MFKIWVCCLIICFLPMTQVQAENLDIESLETLIAEKQYSDALIKIQELRQNTNYADSPELIYNLALSEWNLEQFGPALAHFRLTTYLKPYSIQNLKTLSWAETELENIQKMTLRKDSIFAFITLYIRPQLLFTLGFLLLPLATYVAMRNKPASFSQKLKILAPYAISSLFFFSLFLIFQNQSQRTFATLTASERVNAFAAPSDKAIDIGLLYPGDSVEILNFNDEWWQVKAQGIPSGWVRANNLKVHSRLD